MLTTTHSRLSETMTGRVVGAGDPGFDDARRAFNLTADIRPAAVAFAAGERDVMAVVRQARADGLRVAPQATGHGAGSLGELQDTVLLNVGALDDVSIDPGALRVRAGAGATWEQVVPALSEHGLAALHGSSPDVGVAGYSLGGGIGWLARKHGLQCNSVTAIELVRADGELVRTDADHEPDLFWALRGGGGNFGVVTAIEFGVVPLEELYAGAMFFEFDHAGEVLHAWRELLGELPDELMTWVSLLRFPPLPDVPEALRGGSFAIVHAAFLGSEQDGRRLLRPLREIGPLMDTCAMVPPAALGDMAMDPREPLPYRSAHRLLGDLPAAAFDDLLAAAGPGSDSALTMVQLRHMGGAMARTAPGAGARASLPGTVGAFALGVVDGPGSAAAVEGSLAGVQRALADHGVGDYPNFVEVPADASGFFEPDAWARLRRVKAAHDPGDLFWANHRIPPAR
jgi:hypothetical protein